MNENGFSILGMAMQNRMQQLGDKPPVVDLCTIQKDMSLKPDGYNMMIPKNAYSVMVNHNPCSGFSGCSGSDTCSGFSGCKGHATWQPSAGDRCVVAWIGNEAVILGKI